MQGEGRLLEGVRGLQSFWQALTLAEVSGACGDLGVFIPLVVGLTKSVGLDLGTTLIFTGLYNIVTGAAFGIPMPVQPMKTIAAVALSASPLTIPQIAAAGMFVSGSVLLLGLTRLMGAAQSLIPMAVIKGMQLGLGLDLARKGWQQVWFANSKGAPARGWWGLDGLCLGLAALLFILLSVFPRRDGDASSGSSDGSSAPLLPTSNNSGASAATGQQREGAAGVGHYERGTDLEAEEPDAKLDIASPSSFSALGCMAASAPEPAGASGAAEGEGVEEDGTQALLSSSRGGAAHAGHSSQGSVSGRYRGCAACLRKAQRGLGWLNQQLSASVGGEPPVGSKLRAAAAAGSGSCAANALRRRGGGFQVPAALLLTAVGVVMTLIAWPEIASSLRFGPSKPQLVLPSLDDWRTGILRAGLPQLSLTTFNSVISVCQLAQDLFPDRPASPNAVASSLGAMNLVGGWFGAMPCCHGAGGLAAQTRFGARSGAAPIILGLAKVSLGLLLGSSLFQLLQAFPQPLMGAMLVFAGMELASCARSQRGERGLALMLLTAAVCLAMGNVAIGVAAGLVAAYALLAWDLLHAWLAPRLRRLAAGRGHGLD